MENIITRSYTNEVTVAEESRKVTFVASDSSRDSAGTVVNQEGWDLKRFNSNPIIGYQHDVYGCQDPDNVIGKGYAYVENGKLMVDVEFEPEDINPLAEKIYKKIQFGSLRAVSVGFAPVGRGHWGKGEERMEGKNPTFYFAGQELLEISVVNIPANANALKKSAEQAEAEMELIRSIAEPEDEEVEVIEGQSVEVKSDDDPVIEVVPFDEPATVAENEPEEEKNEEAETPAEETVPESEETTAEAEELEAESNINQVIQEKRMENKNIGELFFAEVENAIRNHTPMEVRAKDAAGINAEEATGAVTLGEIVEPLEKGLVIEKAGAKMQWGLEGEFVSPVFNYCEASIAGENVEVADKNMDLDAVKADPQTSSYACPVSAKALAKGGNILRASIINQCTQAAVRSLNNWLVKPSAIASGIKGVFVDATNDASGALTYAKVQALRGTVEANGVANDGTAAYVMSAKNAAALRATQRGSGDRMVIEEDKIDGIPVIVSEYVGDSVVEYGVFSYAMCGQFGNFQILVDPYTLSKKNQTRFVLNTLFDIKPARQEAFAKMTLA